VGHRWLVGRRKPFSTEKESKQRGNLEHC
jgi:hypothetical protein